MDTSPTEINPSTNYICLEGDTIWNVAQRFGFTAEELMLHNGLNGPSQLTPGFVLHLPVAHEVPIIHEIRYEVLPELRDMHVVQPGGCKKWSFGNAKTWSDFTASGFYPEHTNLKIVALAHVPVEDKDNPTAEAGYYLDSISFGDYPTSGRVRYTTGFRWGDLAEGIAETVRPIPQRVKISDIVKHDEDGFEPEFVEERLEAENPNQFAEDYTPLETPIPCMAIIPEDVGFVDTETGIRFVEVRDFSFHRPNRRLYNHQEIDITGTFEIDGKLYGRPLKSALNGYWFGLPMDLLQSQADVYNADVDTETRAATGSLSWFERNFWVPFSKTAHKNKHKGSK